MQDHAIVIADRNGVIQLWSNGAARLFGFPPSEAIGRKLDLMVPPPFRDGHWHGFTTAMTRGTANGEAAFFDAPVLCRDGEVRTFRGQLHVLRSEADGAIGAMAIFADSGTGAISM
jgi:PAS domain S-box-containing protein